MNLDVSKKLLELPDDYVVGIMPASDTGALEASLCSYQKAGYRHLKSLCSLRNVALSGWGWDAAG